MSLNDGCPVFPSPQDPSLDHDISGCVRLAAGPVATAVMADGTPVRLALSHEAVRQVLIDPRFSRAEASRPGAPSVVPFHGQSGLLHAMDPPEHTALRAHIGRAFTSRTVERLRPEIEGLVAELLDAMEAAGPPADVVAHLTAPLPVKVLCRLLGVPYEDHEAFRGWIETILPASASAAGQAAAAAEQLTTYLEGLIEAKRRTPGDDLISTLLAPGPDGPPLDDATVLANLTPVLVAGHDTTHNQLSNSLVALFTHREQWDLLVRRPELVPRAVDELLRHQLLSRVGMLMRVTTARVDLAGVTLPPGTAVNALNYVANRDPAVFPDPDRLDVRRRGTAKHLAFGAGPHYCPGGQLARLELSVALQALVRRFPGLRPAVPVAELPWKDGIMRGPWHLPVSW
ncbi:MULTISPECIES: cytochrome P450 [unclassified Streptomyces]|uniref:cytochrome P450 n=1 Tax=unclassified Streptomyces TaxID=2593676 RepID=UPI00344DE2F0